MTGTRATVIAYHAVSECPTAQDRHNLFVTPDAFAHQMEYLARKRKVVAAEDIVGGRIPAGRPAVAITFDDGYKSVLRAAGPVLARYGFPATVFVPSAWIGKTNGWIEPTECEVAIMDEDELQAAESIGIRTESHGHDHIDYSLATYETARADIEASLDRIEEVVGRRPELFAYPYGRPSEAGAAAAAGAGLQAAFTIDAPHGGRLGFGRVQITPLDGPRLFALKTSGRYLWIRHARPVAAVYSAVRPVVRRLVG